MRLFLLNSVVLISLLGAFAQNFSTDMSAMNKEYSNLKANYTIKSEMKADNGETSTQIINIRSSGPSRFYAYDPKTELLINGDMKIMLNKEYKVVMIDSSRVQNKLEKLPLEMFDTFAQVYSSIRHAKIDDRNYSYTLIPKTKQYKKIVINYNPTSYRISKIIIDAYDQNSNQNYVMTLSYNYSTYTNIPGIERYIQTEPNGNLKSKSPWQDYELLNYYTPRKK
jgi:hypothetical protein